MSATRNAELRSLSREEIYAVLGRNHVGRIAYVRGNTIDIEPLLYVYSGGWIYGRTSRGKKLEASGEAWWPVTFEVDEVDTASDWRTVVVHGGFYTLSPAGAGWERRERDHAIELLRELTPEAFTSDDPNPSCDVVFRIAVQEITGRAASWTRARPEAAVCGPGAVIPAKAGIQDGRLGSESASLDPGFRRDDGPAGARLPPG